MIKVKNVTDFVVYLHKAGSMATGTDVDAAVVPFAASLVAAEAYCGVVGTDGTGSPTQDIKVDVNKNGTTILTTNKITFTHTALARYPNSYGDLALTSFAKGDVVSFDIDQILNGTSPVQPLNFCLALVFRRKGSLPAAITTGSVIPEGE